VNESPLRWAIEKGHLKIVKYLVKHGSNIFAMDGAVIRLAIEEGHSDIVAYLKKYCNKLMK